MIFDANLFLSLTGWIIGIVSLYIAIKEHMDRKEAQETLAQLKKTGFSDSLERTLTLVLPQMQEIKFKDVVEIASHKYLVTYLNATTTEDPSTLTDVWEKIGVELGSLIQKQVQKRQPSMARGLAECIAFLFVSHYSKNRGQDYFRTISTHSEELGRQVARYYLAISRAPRSVSQLVSWYGESSDDEANGVVASLRGEEYKRVAELFASEKWSRRMTERLREFVRTRQISYNSIASKVLETNPIPKLFLIFKNEGAEPESEEEEFDKHRPVKAALTELRNKGKADLIAYMTSVYFIRDQASLADLLKKLPEGEENNYLVFASAVDPLSVQIKTSDRLDGQPAQLYDRLVKFRDFKEFYESILLRLGVKPSEMIEGADLCFLAELKDAKLEETLRRRSKSILDKLAAFRKVGSAVLTDLRLLDEDDIGYFGSLLAEDCDLSQSEGRDLAEKIVSESKELYSALYETNPK